MRLPPLSDHCSRRLRLGKRAKSMLRTCAIQIKEIVLTPPLAATRQNVSRQLASHPKRMQAKILLAELSKRERAVLLSRSSVLRALLSGKKRNNRWHLCKREVCANADPLAFALAAFHEIAVGPEYVVD